MRKIPNVFFTENCPIQSNTSTLIVDVTANYEGGVATYQCVNINFRLVGLPTIECLSDGTWNDSNPFCISKLKYSSLLDFPFCSFPTY